MKSRLPEDKRAAIEILAIREMLTEAGDHSDSEVEDDGRLKERDIGAAYHWTVSEDQKADILTKRSVLLDRQEWISSNTFVSLRTAKRADEALKKHVPSRPRMSVDKKLASMVLNQKDQAARAAGYSLPGDSDDGEGCEALPDRRS